MLSDSQVRQFWRMWRQVCRQRNWHGSEDERQRKAMLAGCGFDSLTRVDRTAGYDAVKAALLTLLDNLAGAIEADNPDIGRARRTKHVILTETLPCLALYKDDPIAYAEEVGRDKFHLPSTQAFDLDALDFKGENSQLDQFLYTLSRAVDRLRSYAGDSVSDMLRRANVHRHTFPEPITKPAVGSKTFPNPPGCKITT